MLPTVLLVDDSPEQLSLLANLLKDEYEVKLATNGPRALHLAVRSPPDVIVLDVAMPGMDGYAVLECLKGDAATRSVPVLMLTAMEDEAAEQRGLELGAIDFLTKPVSAPRLKARLSNHVVMARADQALRRAHAELEQRVHERTAELRNLTAHQNCIKEEERKRIAREIHDELGGLLTGIKSYLSVAAQSGKGGEMIQPDPHLLEACALADSAMDTVRRVIADLRPSVLDQLGLWTALEWYGGQVEKHHGLCCEVTIDAACTEVALGPQCSIALFRIVQESLTNVVRHAGATHAALRARIEACELVIELQDDGCGIDTGRARSPNSWGLIGMNERVRYLGGELTVRGTPGKGTTVLIRMPMEMTYE